MRRVFALPVMAVLLLMAACSKDAPTEDTVEPVGDTIRVPANAPNIQAAIDRAEAGQVVLVSAGAYSGPGNRDINFNGKQITLTSVDGPELTIIDCQDTGSVAHQGFYFGSRETEECVVDGFSVVNAYGPNGSGMGFRSTTPTIRNCIFARNEAYASGGAVHCKAASPTFINCTFVDNSSPAGGAVFLIAGASPRFERCILAFASDGKAVYSSYTGNLPTFVCCNIYGNAEGDWEDDIAEQANSAGNLSADPLFCDRADGDYRLQGGSPCAPTNNSCSSLIGALNDGCGP